MGRVTYNESYLCIGLPHHMKTIGYDLAEQSEAEIFLHVDDRKVQNHLTFDLSFSQKGITVIMNVNVKISDIHCQMSKFTTQCQNVKISKCQC